MTEADRAALDFASRCLDYPDAEFFASLPALRAQAEENLEAEANGLFRQFLERLENDGQVAAQQRYVALFDHDSANSLYLAWHRYGNDRGQGRALAALNGLYRTAGLEPVQGSMPDYLPRMLEFMAVSDEWAIEVILDGFGPEIAALLDNLAKSDTSRANLLIHAFAPLRKAWPELFRPRSGHDATKRPMAIPEPEAIFPPLSVITAPINGKENK